MLTRTTKSTENLRSLWNTSPSKEAQAVCLKPADFVAKLNVAFPDKEHAKVTLQGEGGKMARALSLALQELVDVLL